MTMQEAGDDEAAKTYTEVSDKNKQDFLLRIRPWIIYQFASINDCVLKMLQI